MFMPSAPSKLLIITENLQTSSVRVEDFCFLITKNKRKKMRKTKKEIPLIEKLKTCSEVQYLEPSEVINFKHGENCIYRQV